MPITRKFIDWSQPLLPGVVEDLIRRYSRREQADLKQVVVAFPGRQGLRRFDELWALQTGGRGTPPMRITVGSLPELLYQPQRPFANELVQQLAWAKAARNLPRAEAAQVFVKLPEEQDFSGWLAIGELLSRQHLELAADGLDFGDVSRRGQRLAGFRESRRWDILQVIQRDYLDQLDRLQLWDQQTARLVAIEQQECVTSRDIVLVGTADMNVALRRMLDQVADRVTSYIHAPESLAYRFDEHGCLIAPLWQNVEVDLDENQVFVVDAPADQARQVARCLRDLRGTFRLDEIAIGVPDEEIVPTLRRILREEGVPTRRAVDIKLHETGPWRLLQVLADWLDNPLFTRFASLARHPDVSGWLMQQVNSPNWIVELDEFQAEHLPSRTGRWPRVSGPRHKSLRRASEAIGTVTAPLSGDPRLLQDWIQPITDFLLAIYGQREFDLDVFEDRVTVESCRKIHQTLQSHGEVPELLMPVVEAHQALRLMLSSVAGEVIPPEEDESAIELLGWLDLPQDDHPVVILTSFNEGFVPSSLNSDLFLPNSLRQQLGLTDNARRYARDLHALQALLYSRQRVSLIVGRRNLRHDPQVPSRLLFATTPETIARRIRRFYAAKDETSPQRECDIEPPELLTERTGSIPVRTSGFSIPRPDPSHPPLQRINVTAFRDYLSCPYRFYLKHVLKLKSIEVGADEISPRLVGTLLHDVLKNFGESAVANSTDPDEVHAALIEEFERLADAQFGTDPLPVVHIQQVQLRERLKTFAHWQATQVQEGWTIQQVELNLLAPFGPEGRQITLSGRIDRIDVHEASGRYRILDYKYKTSKSAKTPERAHRRNNQWIDLQLPLYRHLVRTIDVHGEIELGYVALSGGTESHPWKPAEWSPDILLEADQLACEIVEKILNQEFWPPSEGADGTCREFQAICQEGVLQREQTS